MMGLIALAAASAASPPVYRRLVPIGDTRTWFQPNDYPPQAIAAKAEGTVHFAVEVDPAGRPTGCRITRSGGNPAIDAATCKALMARAAFHPMVDRKGRPTGGTFEQVVRWHLPSRSAEEISDRTFDAHATIAPTGEVVQCTMTGTGNARFGSGGNQCGPFGERGFLAHLMGPDYAKARDSNVRLQVSYAGLPPRDNGRIPDFYLLLAEAELRIDADGTMGRCTSVRALEMPNRSVDLCNIIAMSPPRFPPASAGKRAVFVLDLSVSYR